MKYEFKDSGSDLATVSIDGPIICVECKSDEGSRDDLMPMTLTPAMARNLAKILVIFADEVERQK